METIINANTIDANSGKENFDISNQNSNFKYLCVISHTHWDREWYMPFEQFRIRLVELMDRLLTIIEENPSYVFHLDAQTIVLEDYLEIRPWRRTLLKELVMSGNLIIGPWYLQNDFYLTSGEATVRNLLAGTKIAAEFGRCGKVGYAPDQFGNISQLPQILSGFGIDNFICGRGYSHYEKNSEGITVRDNAPTEFIWEGPDGSKLLAVYMRYWYNNAQRIPSEIEKAMPFIENIEQLFEGFALTPYILLMNGVDHLEAQNDLLPIIDSVNTKFKQISEFENSQDKEDAKDCKNRIIKQYVMEDYISDVKKYLDENEILLITQKGELREGNDWEILKGTLSARVYLKQLNVKAQTCLENQLEPISALYEMAGAKGSYDSDYTEYLWKQLLKNHPHDSICGCSRDEVHDHMEDNYARLEEATSYLAGKKSLDIANHMEINSKQPDDNLLAIFNTLSFPRHDVIEAEIIFLKSENVEAFGIEDINGESQDFIVTKVENRKHDVFTALNLPGVLDVKVFTILLYTQNIEGFAFKGLLIKKAGCFEAGQISEKYIECPAKNDISVEISNEHIKAVVNSKGEITITFIDRNIVLPNAIQIEDLPDRGDAYIFFKTDDVPFYSIDFPATVTLVERNPLLQKVSITYEMTLPKEYDFAARKRSCEKVLCPVELSLTLKKNSSVLEMETHFLNNIKDHRTRLLVDTGIVSDESMADIPFDIVKHDINPSYPDTMSDVHPNTSFAAITTSSDDTNQPITDSQTVTSVCLESAESTKCATSKSTEFAGITRGIAVFTTGEHEYEHLIDRRSTLAFTLVRSTGVITQGADLNPACGSQWNVPGNQCLRELKSRFGLAEFNGDVSSLPVRSLAFRMPMQAIFSSCDTRKFAGGRSAVQGSTLEEFYYLPDIHPEVKIKDNKSIVKIEGNGILVTALKKAEDRSGFVLRIVNMNDTPAKARISYYGTISKSDLSEKSSEYLGVNDITIDLRTKEIATYFLDRRTIMEEEPSFAVQLPKPNAETIAAMDDVDNNRNMSPTFDSVEELMRDLNAKD
jgi:alpha-mannosidase